jgi:hypothetical protein
MGHRIASMSDMQLLRFLFLLIVIAGQLAGGGMFVLCREADGRSVVEMRSASCCDKSDSASANAQLEAVDCHACEDQALTITAVCRDDSFDHVALFLSAAYNVPVAEIVSIPMPDIVPIATFPPADPALSVRRTIVLMV